MSFNTIVREQDFNNSSFAEYGFRLIDSSFSQPTGEVYRAFTVLQDASVSATSAVGDNISSKSLVAGLTVYGKFTALSASSGLIVAYIGG